MTQSLQPLPRLDLAPKLQRPLSFWNPLDYFRLLYWVFFFPQALRWYVNTFGTGYLSSTEASWRKGLKLLRDDAPQRQLLIQGLVLTLIISLPVYTVFHSVWPWHWSVVGFASIFVLSLMSGLNGLVPTAVIFGIGITISMAVWSLVSITFESTLLQVLLGLIAGWSLGVSQSSVKSTDDEMSLGFISGRVNQLIATSPMLILIFLLFGLVLLIQVIDTILALQSGEQIPVRFLILCGKFFVNPFVLMFTTQHLFAWRPDVWLASFLLTSQTSNGNHHFAYETAIPLPQLEQKIRKNLSLNWEQGLENCNEILRYGLQFIPVLRALRAELEASPAEQLVWRVSRLAHRPVDWKIVALMSISCKQQAQAFLQLQFKALWQFGKLSREASKKINSGEITEPVRLDTPARATAAGFWSLHAKDPAIAVRAFNVVRHLLYGEELYCLAHNLYRCHNLSTIDQIQTLTLLACPETEPTKRLRPESWEVIASLERTLAEVGGYATGQRPETRAQALARGQLELHHILQQPERLPEAERALMLEIATQWANRLTAAAKSLDIAIAY